MSKNDNLNALIDAQEEKEINELKNLDFTYRDIPSFLLFVLLFCTVFLQFFTRYILNDSLAFTEELARYLLILLTFVAAIRCQLRDTHLRLEFIDEIAARYFHLLQGFALILGTIFFSVSTFSLWTLTERTWRQKMVSLPFPKYYLYILVMIFLIALVFVHLWQLWMLVKRSKK